MQYGSTVVEHNWMTDQLWTAALLWLVDKASHNPLLLKTDLLVCHTGEAKYIQPQLVAIMGLASAVSRRIFIYTSVVWYAGSKLFDNVNLTAKYDNQHSTICLPAVPVSSTNSAIITRSVLKKVKCVQSHEPLRQQWFPMTLSHTVHRFTVWDHKYC